MGNLRNLLGQRFGRLLVVKREENGKGGDARWLCLCDCGNRAIVLSNNLIKGNTKSCGCFNRERIIETNTTHGFTVGRKMTKEYQSWMGMIARCTNKNNKRFKNYGGRGIKVCDRWKNSFINFYNDMGQSPKGWTIERIDNNKGYEPDNCKWATRKEQANNRSSNHWIEFDGKVKTVANWARELGVGYNALKHRIQRGWSIERALTTPVRECSRR